MKILFLTQYFPPEVGAPQNRIYELAVRLKNNGAQVTILTAMPNYPQMEIYEGYKRKFFSSEEMDGMTIFRSFIFVSKRKSVLFRLLNYFSFVFSSLLYGLFVPKFDIVICESPPLFLGITAYILKIVRRSKLIFNVSDLWPESAEKLGIISNRFFLDLSTRLEEFLYRKSDLITGQTQGIVKNIKDRFPSKDVYWLPNGVDVGFYKPEKVMSSWRENNGFKKDDFICFYAGIIGYAQGLEVILSAAESLRHIDEIKFVFVGSGPCKEELVQVKDSKQLNNIFFFVTQPKSAMPPIIKSMDVSIIPLRKLDLFKGAIPSKIFESLAMGKPILLGVEGEANSLFITEGKAGIAFEPENSLELKESILKLYQDKALCEELGQNGRNYVESYFERNIIAEKFWKKLKESFSC